MRDWSLLANADDQERVEEVLAQMADERWLERAMSFEQALIDVECEREALSKRESLLKADYLALLRGRQPSTCVVGDRAY